MIEPFFEVNRRGRRSAAGVPGPGPGIGRRQVLRSLLGGSLVFPGILAELSAAADQGGLAPRPPGGVPRASRVIWIYLSGGFSHLDSFDPKPKLFELASAPGGGSERRGSRYLPAQWDFLPRGRSGIEVSELFPHIGSCADDLCLVRSMVSDHGNHAQATLGIHTGSFSVPRPSIGSWVSYGLGTLNRNLPSFVVLAPALPYNGAQAWDSSFLPAEHQGTRITPSDDPVPNLLPRRRLPALQTLERALTADYNRDHLAARQAEAALAARIQSFETAFGMQRAMPEALDLTSESDAIHALYGLERGQTTGFAWQCLAARRLAEAGVRFVELIDSGSSRNWDAHGDIRSHEPLARNVDRPVAALLRDLKARGMLDDTLVVFTTEFGRTATIDGRSGRGHQPRVFSTWLAGGGTRAGHVHGASDEIGSSVAADPVHVHDLHATILHLLGFDHTRLTFRHGGRDFRLTNVSGSIVHGLVA